MVKWIGRVFNVFAALKRRLDGQIADDKDEVSILPTWPKKMAEKLTRGETSLDPNTRKPRRGGIQVNSHESLFPFTDNLITLMFIVASDLTEAQRETYKFPFS